jgi:hypothetical protein
LTYRCSNADWLEWTSVISLLAEYQIEIVEAVATLRSCAYELKSTELIDDAESHSAIQRDPSSSALEFGLELSF